MVDPIAELEAEKAKFISIRELFTLLEKKYPNAKEEQLAEWLIKKVCYESNCSVYKQGIAGQLIRMGDDWYSDDNDNNPFLSSLLSQIINNGFPTKPLGRSYTEQSPSFVNQFDLSEYDDVPF